MGRLRHTFICLPTCFHQLRDLSHHLGNGTSSQLTNSLTPSFFKMQMVNHQLRSWKSSSFSAGKPPEISPEISCSSGIFCAAVVKLFTHRDEKSWQLYGFVLSCFISIWLVVVKQPPWKIWKSHVLVGGFNQPSWKVMEWVKVNGKDDIP